MIETDPDQPDPLPDESEVDAQRKPRENLTDDKRAERRDREAESREASKKAAEANIQEMIERSIKDHGP